MSTCPKLNFRYRKKLFELKTCSFHLFSISSSTFDRGVYSLPIYMIFMSNLCLVHAGTIFAIFTLKKFKLVFKIISGSRINSPEQIMFWGKKYTF